MPALVVTGGFGGMAAALHLAAKGCKCVLAEDFSGTHPGAGLPGVLSLAKVVDRMLPPACQFLVRAA